MGLLGASERHHDDTGAGAVRVISLCDLQHQRLQPAMDLHSDGETGRLLLQRAYKLVEQLQCRWIQHRKNLLGRQPATVRWSAGKRDNNSHEHVRGLLPCLLRPLHCVAMLPCGWMSTLQATAQTHRRRVARGLFAGTNHKQKSIKETKEVRVTSPPVNRSQRTRSARSAVSHRHRPADGCPPFKPPSTERIGLPSP